MERNLLVIWCILLGLCALVQAQSGNGSNSTYGSGSGSGSGDMPGLNKVFFTASEQKYYILCMHTDVQWLKIAVAWSVVMVATSLLEVQHVTVP